MKKPTLKTMRSLVSTTKGKALPTARALREKGVPVIAHAKVADGALTVYENGFFCYSTPTGTTVYAVDRCAGYAYDGGDVLAEEMFDDEDWAVRLVLAGEDRLEHNNDVREQCNHFSYSADIMERGDLCDPFDFVADLENRDLIERLLARLTKKQRQVVRMHFMEGMTHQQIADSLSIARQVISRQVDSAIKKLTKKRFFSE